MLLLQLVAVPSMLKLLLFLQLEQFHFYDLQRCYSFKHLLQCLRSLPLLSRYQCDSSIGYGPSVLLQFPHLLQFMPRYQSHGSCCKSAATAPTFYVSSSFDEDKAQNCACLPIIKVVLVLPHGLILMLGLFVLTSIC